MWYGPTCPTSPQKSRPDTTVDTMLHTRHHTNQKSSEVLKDTVLQRCHLVEIDAILGPFEWG